MKWLALAAAVLAASSADFAQAEAQTCPQLCSVGQACKLALDLPFDAEQSVLVATRSLEIGDGAVIMDGRDADGPVTNLGKSLTRIGTAASLGGLYSNADIAIGAGSRVNGPLKTAGAFSKPPAVTVKGLITTNMAVHDDPHELATVTFTADTAPVAVVSGERRLEPGRYGAVHVAAGAVLRLSSGTYYVAALDVAADAVLDLDETKGPVVIYVETTFDFAGLEREAGGEGHVLVGIFGCASDTLGAGFRGAVLAPHAALLLAPRGGAAFGGRFFAESIAVGPKTRVTGLGLTTPYGDEGARAGLKSGRTPVRTPPRLPAPPRTKEAGCFEFTPNGWKRVACASPAFIKKHFPHPDAQLTVTSTATPSLVYGQLAVTLPTAGSEQNGFVAAVAGIPGCVSSGAPTANQFSIQNNTNLFTVPNTLAHAGDTAGVQFAMQSDGSTTGICIWNVDVTTQNYATSCVVPNVPDRTGGALQNFDFGNLVATVTPDGKLSLVGQLSWVPPGHSNIYAVTNVDDTYGLGGHWTQVSGGILGLGDCSQAQFTNAQVVTEMAASVWQGDTDATGPVGPPPLLQPNASAFIGGTGTVETSNLTAVGTATVVFPNADLVVSSLTSSTSGACIGPGHAYVKDNDADFGATPSNLGGQVFWESPDIFLVPHGTPVDLNAVSTETLITPGGQFDIYVRVHNDLGCNPVANVRALVYLADPSALSVQWGPITGGAYVGPGGGATGVTAPAGGAALIGPIPFTAPTSGIGAGHKCILVAIQGAGEAAPASVFDAPASNQVGQRNVQFQSPCIFPLTNGAAATGSVSLTLTVTPNTGPAPTLTGSPNVQVAFDDFDSSWYNVWSAQPGAGASFAVSHSGSTTTVRLGAYSVTLNPVQLAAGQTRNARGTTVLPSGYPSALTLQIGATMTGTANGSPFTVANGGSCVTEPPPIIRGAPNGPPK